MRSYLDRCYTNFCDAHPFVNGLCPAPAWILAQRKGPARPTEGRSGPYAIDDPILAGGIAGLLEAADRDRVGVVADQVVDVEPKGGWIIGGMDGLAYFKEAIASASVIVLLLSAVEVVDVGVAVLVAAVEVVDAEVVADWVDVAAVEGGWIIGGMDGLAYFKEAIASASVIEVLSSAAEVVDEGAVLVVAATEIVDVGVVVLVVAVEVVDEGVVVVLAAPEVEVAAGLVNAGGLMTIGLTAPLGTI